jgi:hypothetical protein
MYGIGLNVVDLQIKYIVILTNTGVKMPRFYFDLADENRLIPDAVGQECPSRAEARREALMALIDVIADRLGEGKASSVAVAVSDDKHHSLLRATIAIDADDVHQPAEASVRAPAEISIRQLEPQT